MKAISYSLFGYDGSYADKGFPFSTYLLGLSFNMKLAELLYPGWDICLMLERRTYESNLKPIFDYHIEFKKLKVRLIDDGYLCWQMLKRMMPVFGGEYEAVVCRDLDSPLSYRERQAVEFWLQRGKAVHAITDSVSHNVAMMGGMVGFKPDQFTRLINCDTFEQMTALRTRALDYRKKGADQTFLNEDIFPIIEADIVQHYIEGMDKIGRGELYVTIPKVKIPGVSGEAGFNINRTVEHIGQAGINYIRTLEVLDMYLSKETKEYYDSIERQFPTIYYWHNA